MNIEKIAVNRHYVWVDKDAEINQDDWVYSTDNTTSSLNIYQINNYIKDQEHPIGFGGKCYLTKQGVGIRIETCKKIIAASPELKLDVPTYVEWLGEQEYPTAYFGLSIETKRERKAFINGYQTAEKELFTEDEVRFIILKSFLLGVDRGEYSRKIEDSIIEQFKQSRL